jgi:hypothetical protein
MTERVKVKCDLYWAFTDRMNESSEKYQVDLCNLSEPAVKALESMGIEVRSKENAPEKGMFVTCKSKLPIKSYDMDGQQLTGFPLTADGEANPQSIQIGNGSKAIALVTFYEWSYKNKAGVSPSLKKLVVTDLVRYEDSVEDLVTADDDDEDEIL